MAKIITTNFITGLGRHTTKSFGTDLGLNKILKAAKEGAINEETFNKMHEYATKAEVAYKFMNFAGKLVGSIVENGSNSPLHNKVTKIPLFIYTKRKIYFSIYKNNNSCWFTNYKKN